MSIYEKEEERSPVGWSGGMLPQEIFRLSETASGALSGTL